MNRPAWDAAAWERIEQLFAEAVQVPSERRTDFLDRACANDPDVRGELESLLRAHDTSRAVLDTPPQSPTGRHTMGDAGMAAATLSADSRVGDWRIVRLIGSGGMGEVYEAHRSGAGFEQRVAIKLLRQETAAGLQRFHAERGILARLEHPGLARLLDGGVTGDGRPYMAIEYVEGQTLIEYCRTARLNLRERLQLFVQICDVVAFAHGNLIIHRDLKPGNIMVAGDGSVKLLDFGIAKLLNPGGSAGGAETIAPLTPDYAAPEQLTGESVTTATDTYALGVILFELLTDERPWRNSGLPVVRAVQVLADEAAPTPSRNAKDRTDAPVPARLLAGDLDAIVRRCLRREPEHRYPTVDALKNDIIWHMRGEPVAARDGARFYVFGRFMRRYRWAVAGAAVVCMSLAIGFATAAWQAHRASLERDVARRAAAREEAVRYSLTSMFRTSIEESGRSKAGAPVTAKTMLDRSAQRVLKEYRDDPQLSGKIVMTLADLYGALEDVEGQVPLLEGFLAQAGPEAEPEAVALVRQKLANVELLRGHADRAGSLLDQAEAFWASDAGRYREQHLEGMFVRGLLQRVRGDLAGSIATYETAIRKRTALSGRVHRETANLYNSLAITLTAANRLDEALRAYRETLAIHTELGQAEDLDALVILGNTGTLAFRTGRLSEAEGILKTAFEGQRALAGDSAAVAASMGLYGASLTAHGRAAEAIPVLRTAADMAVKFTGDVSPLALQDRLFLAEALLSASQREAARTLLKDNLELARSRYGDAHLLTLRLRLAQARLSQAAGEPSQALFDALIPPLRALNAPGQTSLASALLGSGESLLMSKQPSQALSALTEAAQIRQTLLWRDSWELAQVRARLGQAMLEAGDRRGEPLLRQALTVLDSQLGPQHSQTLMAQRALNR